MKISRVTAMAYEVPSAVTGRDRTHVLPVVRATVETDDGIRGNGLVHGVFGLAAIREQVERVLAPAAVGRSPFDTDRLWDAMNPRRQTGVHSVALSAVDIALWDVKGKALGLPVWRLLGGARERVPAYVTFGLANEYPVDDLVDLVQDAVSAGHTRIKMRVGVDGNADPWEDARRVGVVREALGDGVTLMLDGGQGYSFDRALELCNRVEAYDVGWFEEPLYHNDPALLARLAGRSSIPILAGEMAGDSAGHRALIESGAVDLCQPNVCYVGGFTEARRVAALAGAYNLDIVAGGGWPYQNLHLQAGVSNGSLVEMQYEKWREPLYVDPPSPEDGTLAPGDRPGLGFDPDREFLAEHRVG